MSRRVNRKPLEGNYDEDLVKALLPLATPLYKLYWRVDVEGVEPMTSVTPMTMKKRQDAVTDDGYPDAIVKNAPATEDHFFLVPKVVE